MELKLTINFIHLPFAKGGLLKFGKPILLVVTWILLSATFNHKVNDKPYGLGGCSGPPTWAEWWGVSGPGPLSDSGGRYSHTVSWSGWSGGVSRAMIPGSLVIESTRRARALPRVSGPRVCWGVRSNSSGPLPRWPATRICPVARSRLW
jgi:hypothetical protein